MVLFDTQLPPASPHPLFCAPAVGEMGLATAPVVCVATWALFGIQEIGLLIEDPFQVRKSTGKKLSYTTCVLKTF